MTRSAIVAALAVAAVAGGAEAACASSVSIEGNVLVLRAKPGESNHVRVERHPSGAVAISDFASPRLDIRGSSCRQDPASSRSLCNRFEMSSIRAELGDGDDSFRTELTEPATVIAGAGDDLLSAVDVRVNPPLDFGEQPSRVDFAGGAGRDTARFTEVSHERIQLEGVSVTKDDRPNDGRPIDANNVHSDVEVLEGSPQDDFLAGGGGPDTFVSGGGADLLAGKTGDDSFLMGFRKDGQTRVNGGLGRDTVSYAQRSRPVFVSPDDPALRDGEAGEIDSIEETEVIEGGTAADNLVSAPTAPTGYRLIGGAGDDILGTGAGRDRLIGGPGQDRMSSGAESDVVEAQDGVRDVAIDCGSNGDDTVFADVADRTTACEGKVFPQIGVVGLTATRPARADGTARVTLSWRHPVAWQRLRAITLRVGGKRDVGKLTIRPRSGRVIAAGRGVRLAPGSRLVRSGRRVSADIELRLPGRTAGRLTAEIVATDTAGRRQTETRSITITRR